jgi:hypothetical protein
MRIKNHITYCNAETAGTQAYSTSVNSIHTVLWQFVTTLGYAGQLENGTE